VPFHKLSQWLAYSLIEPLEWAGYEVVEIDGLTGLPEYRNGGLFLDSGVLRLKDPAEAERAHEVGSRLVVEWRALTVALLDRIAPLVRERLGVRRGRCRSPRSWRAAPGRRAGGWRGSAARTAGRRCG
jgi:hypothetical protein